MATVNVIPATNDKRVMQGGLGVALGGRTAATVYAVDSAYAALLLETDTFYEDGDDAPDPWVPETRETSDVEYAPVKPLYFQGGLAVEGIHDEGEVYALYTVDAAYALKLEATGLLTAHH